MTDTMQRLTRANPMPPRAPLPDGLLTADALRSVIDERRGIVQTIKPPTHQPDTRRPRWRPAAAIAAFAVVLVVVGLTAVLRPGDRPVADGGSQDAPAATPTATLPPVTASPLVGASPREVAEAYLERVNAGDVAGALSLFSDEFREGGSAGFTDAEGFLVWIAGRWAQYHTTLGGTIDHECAESTPDGTVACRVRIEDELNRRLDIADSEYDWTFRIESGLIAAGSPFPPPANEGTGESRFTEYGSVMSQYDSWGRDNHFEEYLAACRSGSEIPSWSESCAQFRLAHVDEFRDAAGN